MQQGNGLRFRKLSSEKEMRAAARLMAASDPWRKLGLTARHCLKAFKVPYRETLLATAGTEIAGLVTMTMYGTFRGYIQSLFVAPGFRGTGVGAELLARAEKTIFKKAPNVFLCVSSFNKGARRFYRRLGYARVGVLKDFVVRGQDEILLRKTIAPSLGFKGKNG